MGVPKYDWPAIEVSVALVKKHGLLGAALKLGVPPTTLQSHLNSKGVPPEDRRKARQAMNADALREVADLVA